MGYWFYILLFLGGFSAMGRKFDDLTDRAFGRLKVLDIAKRSKDGAIFWRCLCECGNESVVQAGSLRKSNGTRSCGCIAKEVARERMTGKSKYVGYNYLSPEYRAWHHMRERCRNPNNDGYKDYGKRGIDVCDEWYDDFQVFVDYVGPRPSKLHSLGRIDNDKGYFEGNTEWQLPPIQSVTTRRNRHYTFDGITLVVTRWAEKYNIYPKTLFGRLNAGWSIEEALTTPVNGRRKTNSASTPKPPKQHPTRKQIEFQGRTQSTQEWADEVGLEASCLYRRIFRMGWSVEKALTTPSLKTPQTFKGPNDGVSDA